MSLYAIRGLQKVYGGRQVIDIPELDIERGKIYALLGANGTGKTTLLNILAFLDLPTAGSITFDSLPVRFGEKHLQPLRRRVIILDQHPILFSSTVYKNLEFGLKIRKVGGAERRKRIEAALDSVGMHDFIDAQAANLSGGETQRVALARVLVLEPEVLLCDEPTSSVDRTHQAIIIELLRRLHAHRRLSIIFSTHDHALASTLAHRTIDLDSGKPPVTANLFFCTLAGGDDGPRGLLAGGLTLQLPRSPARGSFFIRVNPRLAKRIGQADKGEGNRIEAMIRKVTLGHNRIHLEVDGGNLFSLDLTHEEYRQQDYRVGDPITVHIPPGAIEILEP